MTAPLLDKFAVWTKLDDASVVTRPGQMAVDDENAPVGSDQYGVGFAERLRAVSRHAWCTQGTQNFPILVELQAVVTDSIPNLVVTGPYMIVLVDQHAMGHEQLAGTKGLD